MTTPQTLTGINPSTLVEQAVKLGSGGNALVLGTSSGRNSLYLAHNGYAVTAVDTSQSSLEVLAFAAKQAKLPVAVLAADLSLFKPEIAYDLVVGYMYLHFLDRERLTETARMLQSITKPGGINVLLLTTDKDDEGERPRIFSDDVLPGLYSGWDIMERDEQLADPFGTDQRQFDRVDFMARRPQ